MILVCPRCAARSRLPAERVPSKGAWARCPKCEERFFVKPKGLETPVNPVPVPGAAGTGTQGRSPEAQRIIDRLRGAREAEAESRLAPPRPDQELVTVFPEAAADTRLFWLGLALIGGLMVLAVIFLFQKSAGVSPVAPQTVVEEFKITEYGPDQLRSSLAFLRQSTHRRNYLSRTITTPGLEFQTFAEILERLVPGGCPQGLDSLNLESRSPAGGFEAKVLCRPKGLHEYDLTVRWQDGFAAISLAGSSRPALSIPLTDEAAARATADPRPVGLQPVTSIVDGQVVENFEPSGPAAETPPVSANDRQGPAYQSYEDFLAGQ